MGCATIVTNATVKANHLKICTWYCSRSRHERHGPHPTPKPSQHTTEPVFDYTFTLQPRAAAPNPRRLATDTRVATAHQQHTNRDAIRSRDILRTDSARKRTLDWQRRTTPKRSQIGWAGPPVRPHRWGRVQSQQRRSFAGRTWEGGIAHGKGGVRGVSVTQAFITTPMFRGQMSNYL